MTPSPAPSVSTTPARGNPATVVDLSVYKQAEDKIRKLVSVMEEQEQTVRNNRSLRYTLIDIEAERKAGRLAPDELYVSEHIIDSNIRREQAIYISYLTQPNRTVILVDSQEPARPTDILEKDFTLRTRYEGWQFPLYRSIDGMQQNGYSIIELVLDTTKPGHMALQDVSFGDFGFSLDSKSIQSCEMVLRRYYYTKTQLYAMCDESTWGFSRDQVEKVVSRKEGESVDYKEQSLYCIEKVMFRKAGVVQVAWGCSLTCDDWIRGPRDLFIGRQRLDDATGKWVDVMETAYPFYLLPYAITENTTIKDLKGRSYLDQDTQEAVSSLKSSFITGHRRGSYMMFAKDSEADPNDDVITQTNIIPKSGAVINSKVRQFQLAPPSADMLNAINAMVSSNLQENSQINYAANNRQDSRKTATEIQAATQSSQQLSTVQIALFSSAIKAIYSTFFDVLKSRVMAGHVVMENKELVAMYGRTYTVKPAGDVDVVERLTKIQAMQASWPVIQNTPAAPIFLAKLLSLLFPDDAPQYIAAFQQDDAKTKALIAVSQVLAALIQDPNALGEQEKANIPQLQQLLQQVSAVLQPPQGQPQPKPTQ